MWTHRWGQVSPRQDPIFHLEYPYVQDNQIILRQPFLSKGSHLIFSRNNIHFVSIAFQSHLGVENFALKVIREQNFFAGHSSHYSKAKLLLKFCDRS